MKKHSKKRTPATGVWPLKAYDDASFLHSPDARQIRVLCEFEEPESRFRHKKIRNTIVFFGSARIQPKNQASQALKDAEKLLRSNKRPKPAWLKDWEQAERNFWMSRYYEDAVSLSKKLTEWSLSLPDERKRFYICSGGGPGIMEAANKGAKLAGGRSIGLNISLPQEQYPNPYQTKELSFEFHYFFIRKFWFIYLAKAMVVFPGGFGTLDEFFEVMTLVQTGKSRKKMPIVLYGGEFWNEIVDFDAMIRTGVIGKEDLKLFHVHNNVDDAFRFLKTELTKHYL